LLICPCLRSSRLASHSSHGRAFSSPGLASCEDLYPSTRSPGATELTTSQSQGELDSSASFLCSSGAERGILPGSCPQCAQKSSQSSPARSLRHRSNRSSADRKSV